MDEYFRHTDYFFVRNIGCDFGQKKQSIRLKEKNTTIAGTDPISVHGIIYGGDLISC